MVRFTPSSEMLVFDLEAYVPQGDRRRAGGLSLAVNPYKAGHTLLGGVFYQCRPVTGEVLSVPAFTHLWIWDEDTRGDEAEVVGRVYGIFAGMHARCAAKRPYDADPVVAGVGISTFDMPFLMAKFLQYEVAPHDELYETAAKFRVMDLAIAAIGFMPGCRPCLYPRPHNEMADFFLPDRAVKPSGKVVWEMADAKDYPAIAARCEAEVAEMVQIAEKMRVTCSPVLCGRRPSRAL